MDNDWIKEWEAFAQTIDKEQGDVEITWGADCVEAGVIRRYLEPLEFDCALHYDKDVACEHGYEDIISPNTALMTFAFPALWSPGTSLFTSNDPGFIPSVPYLTPSAPEGAPSYSNFFFTDFEMEFLRPVAVGERIGTTPNRLLSVNPKETKVGRGAFLTFESDIVSDKGDVVAKNRSTAFFYNPIKKKEGQS